MESKKIGILTLPFEPNYGWIMQLWALYNILRQQGYDVTVLDRRWNDKWPSFLKDFQRWIYYNIFCRQFTRFFNSQFQKSLPLRSSEELCRAALNLDTIIVGSDQVWRIENTRGVDLNYFLDFLDENFNIKRISYAASFGNETWGGTNDETDRISHLLKEFTLVSVRESSGIKICAEKFNIPAVETLDPTLLLTKQDYINLLNLRISAQRTLATYILDSNIHKKDIIRLVATRRSLSVIGLYPQNKNRCSRYKSIRLWLESFLNAESIIVDSFHGMVFAILFNKNFVVLGNEKRGMARFTSLLNVLGLESRLVVDDFESIPRLLETSIPYNDVNARLNLLRDKSKCFLIDAMIR